MRGATGKTVTITDVKTFQSTHPVRGATKLSEQANGSAEISIHAPREGCDGHDFCHGHTQIISIHAPREGCDRRLADIDKAYDVFQSTHPVRGATLPQRGQYGHFRISIHAPREGCDRLACR